jgi:DNA-binding response OmpR family regulator
MRATPLFYGTIDGLTFAVPAMKLLLIEDNPTLSHWLAKMLEQEAFALDAVQDGDAADQLLRTNHYDVILLDLNLPKLSGKNVLRRLRQRGDATPVLILTASGSIDEKVELLGAGADDYLVKPFEVRELIARIKVAIRRQSPSKASEVVCGDLAFDIDTRQFTLKGAPLNVTPRERSVLEALILRLGKTVTKPALVDAIFTLADEPSEDAPVVVAAGAARAIRVRHREGRIRQRAAHGRSRAGQSADLVGAHDRRRSGMGGRLPARRRAARGARSIRVALSRPGVLQRARRRRPVARRHAGFSAAPAAGGRHARPLRH